MKRNDTRSIHVFGREWEYKIGKKCVAIYSPDDERYYPRYSEVTGTVDTANLNPQVIKNYIEVTILKSEVKLRVCSRCRRKRSDVSLRVNPLGVEIYDNYDKKLYCDECIDNLSDEI